MAMLDEHYFADLKPHPATRYAGESWWSEGHLAADPGHMLDVDSADHQAVAQEDRRISEDPESAINIAREFTGFDCPEVVSLATLAAVHEERHTSLRSGRMNES